MPVIKITARKDFNKVAAITFEKAGVSAECKVWLDRADHWGLKAGSEGMAEFEDRDGRDGPEKFIKSWNGDTGPKKGGGGGSGGARSNPQRDANIKACSDNKNASILACCAMNNATALIVARATQDPKFAGAISPQVLKAWTVDAIAILNAVVPGSQLNPFQEDE